MLYIIFSLLLFAHKWVNTEPNTADQMHVLWAPANTESGTSSKWLAQLNDASEQKRPVLLVAGAKCILQMSLDIYQNHSNKHLWNRQVIIFHIDWKWLCRAGGVKTWQRPAGCQLQPFPDTIANNGVKKAICGVKSASWMTLTSLLPYPALIC